VAKVAGYDVFTQGIKVRENTGYLPESTPLYQEMRVAPYLTYRATLKGVPRARRREYVERAMERCHVTDVRRRVIGHLSKGYRQRVGLADALVHQPKVLILDEPTSGLDPNQVRDVRDLIKEIAGDTAVLFSTHTIPWVEQVCERVIIIHQGRIVRDGTLDDMRKVVQPWSRVEFDTSLDARSGLYAVEDVPDVIFAENTSSGGTTSLRFLCAREQTDGCLAKVASTLEARGGDVQRVRVGDAILEDLFATLTRGSEQVEDLR
jgi:ABC-2 type transport system ATP-binding protein